MLLAVSSSYRAKANTALGHPAPHSRRLRPGPCPWRQCLVLKAIGRRSRSPRSGQRRQRGTCRCNRSKEQSCTKGGQRYFQEPPNQQSGDRQAQLLPRPDSQAEHLRLDCPTGQRRRSCRKQRRGRRATQVRARGHSDRGRRSQPRLLVYCARFSWCGSGPGLSNWRPHPHCGRARHSAALPERRR